MSEFTLTLTGTKPMIMHNAQLSDPLNKWSKAMKEISAKRKKVDADHLEMARLEFMGGMYYDTDLGPVVPAANIKATIAEGAKKLKLGKAVKQDLQITDLVTPLVYKGPRDLDSLWGDGESEFVSRASVKVQTSRVMRTRPIFSGWTLEVSGYYDENTFDKSTLNDVLGYAGRVGLGDWRPEYGTFTHELEVK